jgi:hypothetical protein
MAVVLRESFVYVLRCENNTYYIGYTTAFYRRMVYHFIGLGSKWTQLHRPLCVIEKVKGDKRKENHKTISYMLVFGCDKVRGGPWCRVKNQNPPFCLRDLLETPKEKKKPKPKKKTMTTSEFCRHVANSDPSKWVQKDGEIYIYI